MRPAILQLPFEPHDICAQDLPAWDRGSSLCCQRRAGIYSPDFLSVSRQSLSDTPPRGIAVMVLPRKLTVAEFLVDIYSLRRSENSFPSFIEAACVVCFRRTAALDPDRVINYLDERREYSY